MAEIMLTIGGHHYTLACSDGEEDALLRLGRIVEEQVQVARQIAPGIAEARQLLFASIFLAEKLEVEHNLQRDSDKQSALIDAMVDGATARITALSQRMGDLADRLDQV